MKLLKDEIEISLKLKFFEDEIEIPFQATLLLYQTIFTVFLATLSI